MVDRDKMEDQLELEEGVKLRVYVDTLGNRTLGIGYNLESRGLTFFEKTIGRKLETDQPTDHDIITEAEARLVLRADIDRVERAVEQYCSGWYDTLNEVRQRVCCDLAFNIGYDALGFKHTIAAIQISDWSTAAREMLNSKWRTQVGPTRSNRLSRMLLTGVDYTS